MRHNLRQTLGSPCKAVSERIRVFARHKVRRNNDFGIDGNDHITVSEAVGVRRNLMR